jgi:hypothetical protein
MIIPYTRLAPAPSHRSTKKEELKDNNNSTTTKTSAPSIATTTTNQSTIHSRQKSRNKNEKRTKEV